MDNRIQEIKKIEHLIKDAALDADSHYKTLGEFIFQNEDKEYNSLIKMKKNSSSLAELKKAAALFEEAESKNEKLSQFRKKVSELNDEIKETAEKNNEIEKDNSKHYQGIADTLFNIYKSNSEEMAALENYFTHLNELDKKNRELARKIDEINTKKDRSLLSKIAAAGEKTVVNSRKKINETQLNTARRKAGKDMCESRIFENSSNKEITGVFSAYISNMKIQEDLEIKKETLEVEKNNFEHEIDEIMIYFENDPDNFLKMKLKDREDNLKDFGKKIYQIVTENEKSMTVKGNSEDETGKKPEYLIDPESEAAGIIEGIKKKNSEIKELENRKSQLEIELEIEKLESDTAEKQKSISKREEKISFIEKEISELETIIAEYRSRIEELKKIQTAP